MHLIPSTYAHTPPSLQNAPLFPCYNSRNRTEFTSPLLSLSPLLVATLRSAVFGCPSQSPSIRAARYWYLLATTNAQQPPNEPTLCILAPRHHCFFSCAPTRYIHTHSINMIARLRPSKYGSATPMFLLVCAHKIHTYPQLAQHKYDRPPSPLQVWLTC